MGDGELDTTLSDFHSMKAVLSTRAKLRTCCRDCRGFASVDVNSENMVETVYFDLRKDFERKRTSSFRVL